MRILYSFPRIVGRSGVGTTAYHQIRSFLDAGHEVSVYAKECEIPLPGARIVRTVPGRRTSMVRVATRGREREWHDLRVSIAMKQHRQAFDALYTWPGGSLRSLAAARQAGIPSFLEVPNTHIDYQHDVLVKEACSLGLSVGARYHDVLSPQTRDHYRREYALASYVMMPSLFAQETFEERGHGPETLLLHRYGYDETTFLPPGETEMGRASERPTILFLGRCEIRKGLHHALNAWKLVDGPERSTFHVVGAFDNDYANSMSALLSLPSVRKTSFSEDPGTCMRDADVFILPSLEEGSALVTYEAQASGCAVLASRACGARLGAVASEMVHAPGDVDALARHLDSLLAEPALLKKLRWESVRRRSLLTWEAAGTELCSTMSSVLG